jgi:hypothetical protein
VAPLVERVWLREKERVWEGVRGCGRGSGGREVLWVRERVGEGLQQVIYLRLVCTASSCLEPAVKTKPIFTPGS